MRISRVLSFFFILPILTGILGEGISRADVLNAPDGSPELYFLQGKWGRAIEGVEAINAPSAQDLNRLGDAYYYSGNAQSAEEAWKKALSVEENADSRISLEMLGAAGSNRKVGKFEKKAEAFGGSARFWRALAIAHMKTGHDDISIYYFYKAVEKDPEDYMSYFFIGTIYENHYAFDDSAKAYKEAVAINPHFAQALNNLGYSYKEMHFWSYAADMYKKALEIMPDNSGFHYNLGNAYNHKGMAKEAFAEYQRAVELDPYFAKAHYNIGKALLRKGEKARAVEELKLYVKYWNPSINPLDAPLPADVKEEIKEVEEIMEEEKKRGIVIPYER